MSEDSKDVRWPAAKPNNSEGWGNPPIWSADERWFLRNRGQDMRLLASPRHFRGLVIVPFLTVMLAFPASAQTSSDSENSKHCHRRRQGPVRVKGWAYQLQSGDPKNWL